MKKQGLILSGVLAFVLASAMPAFSQNGKELLNVGAKVAEGSLAEGSKIIQSTVSAAEVKAALEGGVIIRILKTTQEKFKDLPFYERFYVFYPAGEMTSGLSLEDIQEIAAGTVPLRSLTEMETKDFILNAPKKIMAGEAVLTQEPRELLADYYANQLYSKDVTDKLTATLNLSILGTPQVAREIYGAAITMEPMYDVLFIRSLNALGASDYIQKLLQYRLKQEAPLSPAWAQFKLYGEKRGIYLDIPAGQEFSNETNIMLNHLDLKMFSPQPYNMIFLLGNDVELATDLAQIRESVFNLQENAAKAQQVEQAVKTRFVGVSQNSLGGLSLLNHSKPAGEVAGEVAPSANTTQKVAGSSRGEFTNKLAADLEEFVAQNGGLPARTTTSSNELDLYHRMVRYLYRWHGKDPRILSLVEKYKGVPNKTLQQQLDLLDEYIAWVKENNRLPSSKAPEGSREKALSDFSKTSGTSMDHSIRLKLKEVRGQYQRKPETKGKDRFLRQRQDKFAEYQAWVKENNRLPKQTAPKGSEEKKIATWAYSIVHYYPHSPLAVQLRKMKEEYPKN